MDLKETDILGPDVATHWYYRSKANAMMSLLDVTPSIILDVGAGSGYFSKQILTRTVAKEAWCIDISYSNEYDFLENEKIIHFRRSVGLINADTVLLMDVLEHVDDDVGLLQEYINKVPSGARFIISVPAFGFLWSGHDVFLGHKRRYRLKQLENVVKKAGLTVRQSAYYFGAVFPIALTTRLISNFFLTGQHEARSQLTKHHPIINETLATLSALEIPLISLNRLVGLTAFCLAEK